MRARLDLFYRQKKNVLLRYRHTRHTFFYYLFELSRLLHFDAIAVCVVSVKLLTRRFRFKVYLIASKL